MASGTISLSAAAEKKASVKHLELGLAFRNKAPVRESVPVKDRSWYTYG